MIVIQVIVEGLLLGGVYALFSSGLTLIWGMMNFVNFAHGEFVMLGMFAAFLTMTWVAGGPVLFTIVAAASLFVLGVVVYFALIRYVLDGPIIGQILSTFGLALFLRYAAFFVFSANFVTLPDTYLSGTENVLGIYVSIPKLVGGVVGVLLTIGLHLLLTRTAVGSRILAVAENRDAAMLMGIRPDRMQALAWGLSAALTGVAGAMIAMYYPISYGVGESLALIAFVVVSLGGFGSVPGALLAGILIGVIESLSAYYFGPAFKDVVVYALFVAILWVRPQGLLGTA
ncbi:MAG TPA: branched-chain amino acid ABC transporter permease [bacterium]|nr:branched-chain amino acid ABC transporter permease [bacterium]